MVVMADDQLLLPLVQCPVCLTLCMLLAFAPCQMCRHRSPGT
jgi:hypothetical protein